MDGNLDASQDMDHRLLDARLVCPPPPYQAIVAGPREGVQAPPVSDPTPPTTARPPTSSLPKGRIEEGFAFFTRETSPSQSAPIYLRLDLVILALSAEAGIDEHLHPNGPTGSPCAFEWSDSTARPPTSSLPKGRIEEGFAFFTRA